MQVSLHVNGRPVTWETTLSQTLADALREHGCTSVKCGCEQGTCGMCTVWLDGKPVLSCSLLLCRLSGREVTTVEGVEPQARVLASYLVAEGGDQCGFCAAYHGQDPTEAYSDYIEGKAEFLEVSLRYRP